MSTETLVPEIGQIVAVRQRLYLVDHVIPPPNSSDSLLLRLSCVDDDAQGQALDVLWDRELDAQVITGEAWEAIAKRGLDSTDRFAAYLNTLRWNCVTSTDPNLLQSPFRAGIRLDAYQLEPLRKALKLPRVNLFIADDVGLGKTIEAGLVLAQKWTEGKRRILIVCPAGETGCRSRGVEFAPDSPLEGDGFEPSVPHKKQPVLAARVRSRSWATITSGFRLTISRKRSA